MKKAKRCLTAVVSGVLAASAVLSGCGQSKKEVSINDDHLTVYLWENRLMKNIASYIHEQFPDQDIEFIIGNNDTDLYSYFKEHDELPDIITVRRFSGTDAQDLQPYLMDFASYDVVSKYYSYAVQYYKNEEDEIQWLPICGIPQTIIANKTLFDQYGVKIPENYEDQDKEVLHHISFAMKKNSMTALVGPSGSGKSTIANLLARLWDVKSGNVTIRGVDIRNVPLSELMNQISMVFQRVYLFQDTIYNNIIMGKPDATEEEVYEAARKARCYDFIMALPDGFQTVVGEGGATLSGGEKQRISIARCILKDAPIVILDEATASVDTDNESYIQEAISELVKGKTLLVIAHRLNTIQNADQILVIDNGQIAQQGTHEKLLKQPGIYQDFVNIRKSAAGWSLA